MFGVIAVIGRWRNRHEHRGLIVGQNRLQFLVRVFLDTAFEQIRSAGMMHFEHLPQQFVDLGNIGAVALRIIMSSIDFSLSCSLDRQMIIAAIRDTDGQDG